MRPLTILANDPSLTGWGWVVMRDGKVVNADCIKTTPDAKKKRIRKSDDRIRRIQEITTKLIELYDGYGINYIVAEAPHGSQSATAAVMVGIVIGVLQTFADCFDIPIEWYSEDDAKKCVIGKKTVSKHEMVEAIDKLYSVPWIHIQYKDEAIADALAIYHTACKFSNTLKSHNVSHKR